MTIMKIKKKDHKSKQWKKIQQIVINKNNLHEPMKWNNFLKSYSI